MNSIFEAMVETLEPSFQRLIRMPPIRYGDWSEKMPSSGVYLFSEGSNHLYVGRSRNIRRRLGRHCTPGATHRMAAFAFRLAREKTGNLVATYKTDGGRGALMQDAVFVAAFGSAKSRIRGMDIRFVGEADPLRQTLLEVYCAVALGTPYNDFATH